MKTQIPHPLALPFFASCDNRIAFAFGGGFFMKLIRDAGIKYPTEKSKQKKRFGIFSSPELAAQAYNNFVIENKTLHPLNILP